MKRLTRHGVHASIMQLECTFTNIHMYVYSQLRLFPMAFHVVVAGCAGCSLVAQRVRPSAQYNQFVCLMLLFFWCCCCLQNQEE